LNLFKMGGINPSRGTGAGIRLAKGLGPQQAIGHAVGRNCDGKEPMVLVYDVNGVARL
jgi:hypothetical protein